MAHVMGDATREHYIVFYLTTIQIVFNLNLIANNTVVQSYYFLVHRIISLVVWGIGDDFVLFQIVMCIFARFLCNISVKKIVFLIGRSVSILFLGELISDILSEI